MGRLILTEPGTGNNVDSLYWKYETFLKRCEGRLGALLGANGAIYAIRRDLYVPIPPETIVDDFVIPLLAKLRSSCTIIYDCEAVAREETPASVASEFHRRARIGAGGFQSIALLWRLLDPRQGWIAFSFLSHKVLRWLCPFFLIGLLVTSALLWDRAFFRWVLAAQVGFYATSLLAALAPPGLRVPKPIRLMMMFTSMNAAPPCGIRPLDQQAAERRLEAYDPGGGSHQCPPMNSEYLLTCVLGALLLFLAGGGFAVREVRRRSMDRWLSTYIRERSRRHAPNSGQPVHLLLCIADHFEPRNGEVTLEVARGRMQRWAEDYPRLCQEFRDSDGRPPRHTFFYPIEQYDESDLGALAEICRLGLGEVEIHLHHDRDSAENLERTLTTFKELLARQHGLLARHRDTGELAYGFVHGDWALDNARPDGRCCGVNNEIEILRADWVLRRFHAAIGARPDADPQDQ